MTDVWRCDITGNPVGTDTRMVGAPPCECQGCKGYDKDVEAIARIIDPVAFLNGLPDNIFTRGARHVAFDKAVAIINRHHATS